MSTLKTRSKKSREGISILINDQAFAATQSATKNALCLSSPKNIRLDRIRRVVVITNALQLEEIAHFVHRANDRKRLLLLVRQDDNQNWITQLLERADVRTLRNMLVHSGLVVPKRVLTAWESGAQEDLIADAAVIGDRLFVIDCALNRYEIQFEKMKALAQIPIKDRHKYTISEEGGCISWEDYDVDINLESLRVVLDPVAAEKSKTRKAANDRGFGAAIAKLRKDHNIPQNAIAGLTDRQIRRIEAGEQHATTSSLRHLAAAHKMNLQQYLSEIARWVEKLKEPSEQLKRPPRERNGANER
jgi:hypothetical protein